MAAAMFDPAMLNFCGTLIAAASLVLVLRRDGKADREERDARSAEQRGMADKLDNVLSMTKETRDTVKDISRQLNDHSRKLAKMETQLEDHGRRLTDLEHRIGRTD